MMSAFKQNIMLTTEPGTDLVADIPIIGAVLGGSNKCNGQIACCNLSPSPVPAVSPS